MLADVGRDDRVVPASSAAVCAHDAVGLQRVVGAGHRERDTRRAAVIDPARHAGRGLPRATSGAKRARARRATSATSPRVGCLILPSSLGSMSTWMISRARAELRRPCRSRGRRSGCRARPAGRTPRAQLVQRAACMPTMPRKSGWSCGIAPRPSSVAATGSDCARRSAAERSTAPAAITPAPTSRTRPLAPRSISAAARRERRRPDAAAADRRGPGSGSDVDVDRLGLHVLRDVDHDRPGPPGRRDAERVAE